jgi:hypothetical protein
MSHIKNEGRRKTYRERSFIMINRKLFFAVDDLVDDIRHNESTKNIEQDIATLYEVCDTIDKYVRNSYSQASILKDILEYLKETRDENNEDSVRILKGEERALNDWYTINNLIETIEMWTSKR